MKVIMHDENHLEFRQFDEPGMDVDADNPELHYSALQMFATSLALCTYSMLHGYADMLKAGTENLSMSINWEYEKDPMRIGRIDMNIHWPDLPESRLKAAQRAAAYCTLHQTLEHPPEVNTKVEI